MSIRCCGDGERHAASAGAVNDATFGEIVGRQFDGHFIAGQDADVVLAHLAGNVRGHGVTIFEFYAEHGVGQGLGDRSFHLNHVVFRHKQYRFVSEKR